MEDHISYWMNAPTLDLEFYRRDFDRLREAVRVFADLKDSLVPSMYMRDLSNMKRWYEAKSIISLWRRL